MSSVFQLGRPKGALARSEKSRFEQHGLVGNPFPEPGLDRGVLYSGHMTEELERINGWLDETQRLAVGKPVSPMAIRGTIGVGKTHLLKAIQNGLETGEQGIFVCRRALTEGGMKNLLLANLLLESLPPGDESIPLDRASSSVPLLDRLVVAERMMDRRGDIQKILNNLGSESSLRAPLQKLFAIPDARTEAETRKLLAIWLKRGHTTPVQRNKIGVTNALEGEGQAVRAVADLMRVAQGAGLLKVWFVLLDQLEELFRPNVITPGRRARFLTDLRFLVDLAYEGAPIAVLVAWNTEIAVPTGSQDDPLQREYRALWRRLADPVDLPGLPEKHIWPFAQAYLEAAQALPGRDVERKRFIEQLELLTPVVTEKLKSDQEAKLGAERFMTARVLHHWRLTAEELSQKPPNPFSAPRR